MIKFQLPHTRFDQIRDHKHDIHFFLKKQQVYKQQAQGWQIAKLLSGLNQSHNVDMCDLLVDTRHLRVKPTMHQNSAVSKASLGKF